MCELKLVKRTRPCLATTYGPFFNYVDHILPNIDHQFSVDIVEGIPLLLKFIYSEKVTKFCEISTVDLTVTI